MKYDLKKREGEIEMHFNIRKAFIDILNPKTKKKFKLYEMYSNIFINILFLKCRYREDTENFIKNFIKKNGKKIKYNIKNMNLS